MKNTPDHCVNMFRTVNPRDRGANKVNFHILPAALGGRPEAQTCYCGETQNTSPPCRGAHVIFTPLHGGRFRGKGNCGGIITPPPTLAGGGWGGWVSLAPPTPKVWQFSLKQSSGCYCIIDLIEPITPSDIFSFFLFFFSFVNFTFQNDFLCFCFFFRLFFCIKTQFYFFTN